MALIEFRNVQKAFGPKVIYRGLDLHIEAGEALTIIGGSGQGKSVMLRMLIGLLGVDGGEIVFDGKRISGLSESEYLPIRRRIAMLFQAAALFDSMTVGENVAYGLRSAGELGDREITERVAESLSYVGLEGKQDLWPGGLSSGMKKRVGLARAIAMRPDVLLYDEPTTGLDPININRIIDLILHLQRTLNITSVVVTHDMHTAIRVSNRIAMIANGGIIFSGDIRAIVTCDDPRVKNFIEGNAVEDSPRTVQRGNAT